MLGKEDIRLETDNGMCGKGGGWWSPVWSIMFNCSGELFSKFTSYRDKDKRMAVENRFSGSVLWLPHVTLLKKTVRRGFFAVERCNTTDVSSTLGVQSNRKEPSQFTNCECTCCQVCWMHTSCSKQLIREADSMGPERTSALIYTVECMKQLEIL